MYFGSLRVTFFVRWREMNKVNQWKDDEIPYKKNNTVHLSKFLLETGVSDFHLVILTFMRKRFKQSKAKLINYSLQTIVFKCSFFQNLFYRFCRLYYRLSRLCGLSRESRIRNDSSFPRFCDIGLERSNRHAPCDETCSR